MQPTAVRPGLATSDAGDSDYVFSYPMLRDLEREQGVLDVFTGIAAHRYLPARHASKVDPLEALRYE